MTRPLVLSDMEAVDLIYGVVDRLLSSGMHEACDELLTCDYSGMPSVCLLAILSATWPAREHLVQRATFVGRVRGWLTERDPARVDDLLAGLE